MKKTRRSPNSKGNAFAAFAAARERLGLETKPEDFKSLSAADLNKLAEDLGGIKKAAASGSGFSYPTSNNNPTGFTVGEMGLKKEGVG